MTNFLNVLWYFNSKKLNWTFDEAALKQAFFHMSYSIFHKRAVNDYQQGCSYHIEACMVTISASLTVWFLKNWPRVNCWIFDETYPLIENKSGWSLPVSKQNKWCFNQKKNSIIFSPKISNLIHFCKNWSIWFKTKQLICTKLGNVMHI